MVTCAFAHCKNTSTKTSKCKNGISFHIFPKNEERRKKWEVAIKRENEWTSTSSSAVCSEHFDPGDFYLTSSGLRRLSEEAVPVMNTSSRDEPQPTITTTRADIKPTDTEEVVQLKQKLKSIRVIAEQRKRKIKVLWQTHKRMRAKIDKQRRIIQDLIDNKENRG